MVIFLTVTVLSLAQHIPEGRFSIPIARISETIKQVVRKEISNNTDKSKLYSEPRIYNNLLSSQPLCFNLFGELQQNLQLATEVFKKLCPDRVKQITAIEFEYSPGRGDEKYTGDRSAFDVYVEFLNMDGQKGFIGIEVKYHENLKNKPAEMRERYSKVARDMKCFKEECMDKLKTSPLEQIWRDHLLAGSLLNKGDFTDGFFVFLSPEGNLHCQEAVEQYKKCLTDEQRTFESWTLEEVVETIKQNTKDKWIDELFDRYLNFKKLG